jgi:hypothetical protein
MSLVEKMKEYDKHKAALEVEAKQLKRDFELYIRDKSIPLVERWAFFESADDAFKNHSRWIITASSKGLKYVMDNRFDAPEVYGRGKQIFTARIFEECVWDGQLWPENFAYDMDKEKSEKLLTEALEEVLQKNIGSFCFDW